jgi:DNA-binding NarL/FixJ family response regulator
MGRFRNTRGESSGEPGAEMLTDREMAVLKMAATGRNNSAIAEEMHLSVHTVESHLGAIFNKIGVGSRTEAVIHAIKRGWLTIEELP